MERMMGRFALVLLCLAVFSGCSRPPRPALSERLEGKYKGYNVVLVVVDALRTDHLSAYGYGKKTSPVIDSLAAEGVLFENAFSQSALTVSSIASIFTSLHPSAHGMLSIYRDTMPDKARTLAQVLGYYGYATAWYGALRDSHTGMAPRMLKGFREKELLCEPDMTDVRAWLSGHRSRPFFLTVHSYFVHERYFYGKSFPNRFYNEIAPDMKGFFASINERAWSELRNRLKDDPRSISEALDSHWVEDNWYYLDRPYSDECMLQLQRLLWDLRPWNAMSSFLGERANRQFDAMDGRGIAEFMKLYDSAVYEMDRRIIRPIADELKHEGIWDKTIVIVTADHGNEYKERGVIGHGESMYDECIHIPLVFRIPGMPAVRVKELAASIDIMPTLLELLGIAAPEQMQGISLLGLVEHRPDAASNRSVITQSANGTVSIRTGEWKLMRGRGTVPGKTWRKLYNLKNDPGEREDLDAKMPGKADELEAELDAQQSSLPVWYERKAEFPPGVDEKTKERIRKTGYW